MRGRRHKLQVSTFPFLAVLLCAMGSLILVLLVMDRKAHKAAQARARQQATQLAEESARNETARQTQREQLKEQARKEWEQKRAALHEKLTREQIEMQLTMRKVRDELQGIAARLHYEQDTTTQLRHKAQDERSRLQAEEQLLATLRSNAKQTENQSKESSQALRRMTLDLLQIEQVLKDLKAAKKREQKTFSVVPYHGRRGENRRPLYVECSGDGVIFHPERKAMPITSLMALSGDVRAEVERRIAQQRQKLDGLPSNVDKTPYLLLLLRPSGVTTYHMFQRALRGLPLDFGYEFIDDDWVLDFPADDELPSKQPWMIATKTPSRPASAPVPSVAASPPPRTSPRPMGGPPLSSGGGGAFQSGGIRGFRASESGGGGSWVKGDGSQPGASASGAGGGPAGTSGGPGGTAAAMPGSGGVVGSQAPFGSGGGLSDPRASASGPGVPLADARGSGFPGNGSGHGHPSAMPPTFPNEDGGNGFSGRGGGSGSGFRGGLFPTRASNSGSGYGAGFPANGSPGDAGSDLPGLGPPQALASGSGGGYAGSGTGRSGFAGTGSVGNGVPGNGWSGGGSGGSGNGWSGGGSGGSGVPGSPAGMSTSADGRFVIARGNNFGDAPGSAFNGGGGGFGGGGGGGGAGGSGLLGANGGGGASGTGGSGLPGMNGGGGVAGAGGSGLPGMNGGGGAAGTGGPGLPGASGGGGSPSGTSIGFGPSFGVPGSGGSSSGTPNGGGGGAGGQAVLGTPMPNPLAGGGSPTAVAINGGPDGYAQGSGGVPSGSGQALSGGGGAAGNGGSAMPGAPQSGGAYSTSQINNVPNSGQPGVGSPSQGVGGASGGPTVIGGTVGGQAATGGSMQANGGRSSDVVIFVDPLTGKPTTAPRPAPPPDDASNENPQPEQAEDNHSPRRIRVIPVTGAASGGNSGPADPQAEAMNRYAPTPSYAPPPKRLTAPRPTWVHGGRDWTIFVECRAGDLVLYPSQRTFTLAQAITPAAGNPLVQAIQQMIDRRQSSRRAGEPPYHVQVCLLVRPEHIGTFLTTYPALEALPVKKMRRNLDADDDVISIVTGAVP